MTKLQSVVPTRLCIIQVIIQSSSLCIWLSLTVNRQHAIEFIGFAEVLLKLPKLRIHDMWSNGLEADAAALSYDIHGFANKINLSPRF